MCSYPIILEIYEYIHLIFRHTHTEKKTSVCFPFFWVGKNFFTLSFWVENLQLGASYGATIWEPPKKQDRFTMFIHVLFELFGEFEYRMIELFQIFFMIWSNKWCPNHTTYDRIEMQALKFALWKTKTTRATSGCLSCFYQSQKAE